MQKTEHYQLNQWDAEDSVKRIDFNDDNARIDAAIKAAEQTAAQAVAEAKKEAANALAAYQAANDAAVAALEARPYFGSWVGNGTVNRTIKFPFAPRFLLIIGHRYDNGTFQPFITMCTQELSCYFADGGTYKSSLESGGVLSGSQFTTGTSVYYNNYSGEPVYYLAVQ